ncbi:MAG: hypothetical protein UU77_C0003G0002 [candidate division WWE3 bacterium GW2011_GWC1_41_7]|uniref:Uncharacterized protein n=3 Tax=Katanobacteria TaxID=422282 RepID=A0A0G0XCR1_UNCKA|nr:MAG: hypothetical protein UU72_C0010G0006 [candidate division WWE3 bacterium GW2011_GWB1_41_6]KKS21374.1 MAG: hypothetical protein UU77_C0003G0002 [candidate division WWE3 bacterium GW2011_GWC1_41_7]KKS22167.1 MAG: hypothetical protein UU80_C0012G0006 [candidate division WWE3 bacterium GW2011_GWA1_41_8]
MNGQSPYTDNNPIIKKDLINKNGLLVKEMGIR